MFRKVLLLVFAIVLSLQLFAQLEVKEGSFKEVAGFVNINTEKMYDDNDKPYSVLKVRTENINDRQRRELNFGGDAQTFFEIEYKDGEVWLYISYYATFLKISHPDLSSTEFYFPFDMEPKKGYEMTLVNKPTVDEDIIKRLEKLENANNMAQIEKPVEKPIEQPKELPKEQPKEQPKDVGYITVKTTPKGAFVLVDNKIVGITPYLSEAVSVGNHKISVSLEGYEPEAKRVDIEVNKEISINFILVKEEKDKEYNSIETQQTVNTKPSYDTLKVLKGEFSVSSYQKVRFSRGNLQYNDSNRLYQFAKNQWNIAGDGWIDLFVWSEDTFSNIDDGGWRLLSSDEWAYLLTKRITYSGDRYAKAIVNGVKGVVLLPDNWNPSNYELINTNKFNGLFNTNRISAQDWKNKFEAKGAVFLPAAGNRTYDVTRFVGTEGDYWSSSLYNDNRAYLLNFDDAYLGAQYGDYIWNGNCIRLVIDVE